MINTFDIIITITVITALCIASITDLKKREVPDWISYGLLFFVLSTRTLQAIITKTPSYFYLTIASFFIFLLFGNLMYFTKQWGGGDTKLITSLGSAFALRPSHLASSIIPFPLIILINILIVGTIYGMVYAIILAIKNKKIFSTQFSKINSTKKIKIAKSIFLTIALLMIALSFKIPNNKLKIQLNILALFFLTIPYIFSIIKSVENSCMYRKVKTSKLEEGDWVEENIYKKKKLIYKKNPYGITKQEINKLKKEKIKLVLIKEGIPFVPSFLLGTLITLIVGEIVFIKLLLP